MAGFSDHAYRQIVRRFGGVGLPVTEMVSARAFLEVDARGEDLPERLWGVKEEPRPLAVQIWDNDPGALAAVADRLVREFRVSLIDINFGCPVRQITHNAKSGSYLLRYPDRVARIVSRVARACHPAPVTAKIRLGPNRRMINASEVCQAIEDAGGAAVTVHGRTAEDQFRGQADWDRIADVKRHLRTMPLIGNGDLNTPESVVDAFRQYGVDGVMIGRAALYRPWLFRQAQAALLGEPIPLEPTLIQQRQLLLDHCRMIVQRFGQQRGTIQMRKYACCYVQGRRGAKGFRSKVVKVTTHAEFIAAVEDHFPVGAVDD